MSTTTSTTSTTTTTTTTPPQATWTDGFESGSFSEWSGTTGNGIIRVLSVAARTGTYGARFEGLEGDQREAYVYKTLDTGYTTVAASYYLKFLYLPGTQNNSAEILSVSNGDDSIAYVFMDDSDELILYSWNGTDYTETKTGFTPVVDTWYNIEIRVTVDNGSGTSQLIIDEVSYASVSSLNNTSLGIADNVKIGSVYLYDTNGGSIDMYVDDVTIDDAAIGSLTTTTSTTSTTSTTTSTTSTTTTSTTTSTTSTTSTTTSTTSTTTSTTSTTSTTTSTTSTTTSTSSTIPPMASRRFQTVQQSVNKHTFIGFNSTTTAASNYDLITWTQIAQAGGTMVREIYIVVSSNPVYLGINTNSTSAAGKNVIYLGTGTHTMTNVAIEWLTFQRVSGDATVAGYVVVS